MIAWDPSDFDTLLFPGCPTKPLLAHPVTSVSASYLRTYSCSLRLHQVEKHLYKSLISPPHSRLRKPAVFIHLPRFRPMEGMSFLEFILALALALGPGLLSPAPNSSLPFLLASVPCSSLRSRSYTPLCRDYLAGQHSSRPDYSPMTLCPLSLNFHCGPRGRISQSPTADRWPVRLLPGPVLMFLLHFVRARASWAGAGRARGQTPWGTEDTEAKAPSPVRGRGLRICVRPPPRGAKTLLSWRPSR